MLGPPLKIKLIIRFIDSEVEICTFIVQFAWDLSVNSCREFHLSFSPLSFIQTAGLGIRSLVFLAIACFLRKNERMTKSLKKTSHSIIRSFLVRDLSESLMVAYFW